MIKVYNRRTKEYEIEKVAGGGVMKYLYGTSGGKAALELMVKRKFYSALTGLVCDTRLSSRMVKGFADEYKIDISSCKCKIEEFKSFNDFFTRELKPEARHFGKEPGVLPSPGDGRVRVWMDINMESLVQVKGMAYSLVELVGGDKLAHKYHGGVCILLRLAPVDYHRFHFMDSGFCTKSSAINGDYYSVNPMALKTIPQVFCRNKREYSTLHSDNFGDILYVEVGATSVGSIVQTYKPEARLLRGDEKGYFKFGGSTIVLFLEKGAVKIDEEILNQTEMGYETHVLAGEGIGRKS